MRLTIKNGNPGPPNGTNGSGTHRSNGAPNRPILATAARVVHGAAAAAKEGALQILDGVVPYVPRIRVRETNEAIVITGHLRDVDEGTVEVTFLEDMMKIRGSKSTELESIRRNYRSVKKVYRTFERRIPIRCDVHVDKVVATFGCEVLRIHVPKKGASSVPSKSVPTTTVASLG